MSLVGMGHTPSDHLHATSFSQEALKNLYLCNQEHVSPSRKKVVRHVYRIKEQLTDGPSLTPCGGNLVLRSGKYGRFYGC